MKEEMDIIIELLVAFLVEAVESVVFWGATSEESPKGVRYVLGAIGVLFIFALVCFMIFWGILLLDEGDILWGCICTGAGAVIGTAFIAFVISRMKKKKKSHKS